MIQVDKEKILKIVNDYFRGEKLTTDDYEKDLLTLGLDSIGFVKVIISVEETFDCELPDDYLLLTEMNTINKIFDVILSIKNRNKRPDNCNKKGIIE